MPLSDSLHRDQSCVLHRNGTALKEDSEQSIQLNLREGLLTVACADALGKISGTSGGGASGEPERALHGKEDRDCPTLLAEILISQRDEQ